MHACILKLDGNTLHRRTVKNLGWLLRNWKRVTRFHVRPFADGSAQLRAYLDHDYCFECPVYQCEFASASVLYMFLDRPIFRGLKVNVHLAHDKQTTVPGVYVVGTPHYRAALVKGAL